MIQLAIISDIHANIIALNAVLKDIEKRALSTIYCLGDLVDFAPWGNEVIDLLRANKIPCLLGNHDQRIAFDEEIIPLAHHHEQESFYRNLAINHSKASITPQNKKWLASLPYNLELTYKIKQNTVKILLVHATPQSNDAYVYEEELKNSFSTDLNKKGIDALVMGHTHLSFAQRFSKVLFVNAGSVGRSREQDRKASYCIITIDETGPEAEIVKIDYDLEKVAHSIYRSEIPDFYGDFLLQK